MPRTSGPRQARTCPECNGTFHVTPSDTQVFCSPPCVHARNSRKLRAPHLASYSINPRRCPCGEPIPYAKRHQQRYCSPTCKKDLSAPFKTTSKPIRRRAAVLPEQVEQAVRMYTVKGYGIEQIADALDCTPSSVKHALEGMEKGERTWRRGQDWEVKAARKLREGGMSVAAIARKLGRSPGTVINWVRDVPVIGATAGPGPRSAGQVRVKRVLDREEKLELQALVDSQDAERAVDLYRGGMSMLKTAVEVGRSEEWVKARLVEEGVFRG